MHLLYIVSIDISIQKKIAFIAMLHHFILSFLILFIYLQYARIDVKSTFNNFFKTSLSFLTIIILILSSSCASLNQNSAKKAVTTAVKAKINSRNYVIEMPKTLTTNYKRMFIPEYIHVSGDSLLSFTEYDNQDELNYYQKDFVEQMQSAKYKIFDYTQTQHRGGRIEVSFWYNSVYKGNDPQIVVINQGNLIPVRYKLVFGRSNKVRIYRDSYAIAGILKL